MKKVILVLLFLFSLFSFSFGQSDFYKHPDWAKNASIYEVNIRQYTPQGTFKAFEASLPRLKEMGVDILWIMPIYPIGELNRKGTLGSYYAVKDYRKVNQEFGTLEDFKALVKKAHEMGFKVILDWVANHSAPDNYLVKEHPEWYKHDSTGKIIPPVSDWADVAGFNYDKKGLWDYQIESMKYWIKEADVRPAAEPAAQPGGRPSAQTGERPSARANGRAAALADAVATPITRERAAIRRPTARTGSLLAIDKEAPEPVVTAKLADATRAYSADRYHDALRMLRKLSSIAPTSASVKELLGLTLYRLGKWPLALRELEAHHRLSGSYDQFPVIADCYRALRRYDEADAIWTELRQASPSPEVIAEGRLVAAGSLADRGDLRGAVKLLEGTLRRSKPKGFHLRQWYALADLYERAGELPRARDLFAQIAAADPDAYDVKQRLIALD